MARTQTPWQRLKSFPAERAQVVAHEARGKDIMTWFQDEARIGQRNKITRRRAGRDTRPSAPRDQRTRSARILGATGRKNH